MYRRVKRVLTGALVSIGLMSFVLILPGYAQTSSDQGSTPQTGSGQASDTQAATAQIQSGQKVETKGLILTRDGENMTVETRDMGNVVVELHPETKVQVPKGIFRHKQMEATSLVPGLDVEVKGTGGDNGHVIANEIQFTNESLRIARQAHAAMTATKAQTEANKQDIEENQRAISANQEKTATNTADIAKHTEEIRAVEQRFSDLTEYDIKKNVTVNFDTGKSAIPADAKQQLSDLAKEAQGLKGYLIEVKGFASTSGGAQRNQDLSEERSENVVTFLQQQGIPPQHIVNPAAMGTTFPTAANDTEMGRMQNQRVEVKILVNRAVGGSK